MKFCRRALVFVAALWLLASWHKPAAAAGPATQPAATQPSGASQFMRFIDDGAGGGKLETAVATYVNSDGVTVHLVAAVHVGEKTYYESLNQLFHGYDAVLYEMVKSKEAGPPAPGQKSHSYVSSLQHFLKDALGLDFQLDDIDYASHNFVHADLDAESFASMQKERGESILGMMIKSMIREMERQASAEGAQHPQITLFDLFAAMRAPDHHRQLKLLLARQFDDIEDQMSGLEGPDGSVIITERNKKCLDVLKKVIIDGDRNIGIFYGAGHMMDMSQRLEAMGFKPTGKQWRMSWDMTQGAAATQPAPAAK